MKAVYAAWIAAVVFPAGLLQAEQGDPLFREVTQTCLPTEPLRGLSMDAHPIDVESDGDLDLLIAHEHRPNILLINNGSARFTDESEQRIPQVARDSEDIEVSDLDGDGHQDAVVVSEDDRKNELYLNHGDGTFEDAAGRLPAEGTSNAVEVADLNGNGHPDLVIGNDGQSRILINEGDAQFTDETERRLPVDLETTQDFALGDVDGDGDLDLLVGNEGDNRLWLNADDGFFEEAPQGAIPLRSAPEETREADLGDIDGDGDLDILFTNTEIFVDGADPQNRLLINDGSGTFEDVTTRQLPADRDDSFDGDFVDVDADGDLDIVTCNTDVERKGGLNIKPAPYRVYVNDGEGNFSEGTDRVYPKGVRGRGFDAEAADFNGDGRLDLYLASRCGVDRLLLNRAQE